MSRCAEPSAPRLSTEVDSELELDTLIRANFFGHLSDQRRTGRADLLQAFNDFATSGRLVTLCLRQPRNTTMDIKSVRDSHERQLMQLPNVNGVGIGKKEGKEVIKVFVTRKVPEDTLRPHEVVPRAIGGFEIDVEELGVVSAENQ